MHQHCTIVRFGKFYSAIQSSSLLLPPSLCGWSSSLHSAEMPTTGAKFNSKSKHEQRLRIKTPLRFTQLQFYQFPPGKNFPLKLLCIRVHSGMQVWVFGVGQFTYRMNVLWASPSSYFMCARPMTMYSEVSTWRHGWKTFLFVCI